MDPIEVLRRALAAALESARWVEFQTDDADASDLAMSVADQLDALLDTVKAVQL